MSNRGLAGAVLGVAAVFGMSWLAAITCWRLGSRVPGPGEIAGLMLGMPAALAGIVGWWRRPGPASTPQAGSDTPVEASAGHSLEIPRFTIRAAAIELPTGNDAAQVLAAAAAGPGLHPSLRDPQGFGVLAAEVGGLHIEAVNTGLAVIGHRATTPRPETSRALGLAEPVLEQLLASVASAPVDATLLVPAHWSEAERELARRWLVHRLAVAAPELVRQATVIPVASGLALWGLLRAVPVDARGAEPLPRLWLSAASNIGAGTVERWARRGILLGAATPQGRAPGEAAAGVILDPDSGGDGAALAYLLPCPSPSHGPDDGQPLPRMIEALLSATGTGPGDIHLLVSDSDHRLPGCSRLASATSSCLPEIDPSLGLLRLGQGCGHADATLALAALAVCAQAVAGTGRGALAMASDDSGHHEPMLVKPHPRSS